MRALASTRFIFQICLALLAGGWLLAAPAHAGPRLDKIMQAKVLRVGTPGDYRPFSIKTDEGYSGLDIELAEKMAAELGLKVEFVPTTWPDLAKDFQADKFDVAVGGITRTHVRAAFAELLPAYAPFGKVALVRVEDKDKFTTPQSLNQPGVRVIKNPGGTNEQYVLRHLPNAQVSTHEKNAEIPALIAEGKGDVMITETPEAIHYSKANPKLHAAFVDHPLTPVNFMGFMVQKDDADYVRVMQFTWNLLELRGEVKASTDKWLR